MVQSPALGFVNNAQDYFDISLNGRANPAAKLITGGKQISVYRILHSEL
jgi:hypothetical protein